MMMHKKIFISLLICSQVIVAPGQGFDSDDESSAVVQNIHKEKVFVKHSICRMSRLAERNRLKSVHEEERRTALCRRTTIITLQSLTSFVAVVTIGITGYSIGTRLANINHTNVEIDNNQPSNNLFPSISNATTLASIFNQTTQNSSVTSLTGSFSSYYFNQPDNSTGNVTGLAGHRFLRGTSPRFVLPEITE